MNREEYTCKYCNESFEHRSDKKNHEALCGIVKLDENIHNVENIGYMDIPTFEVTESKQTTLNIGDQNLK